MVTVQEFLQMPEIEGERRELIGGEVVTMGFGKSVHEIVKKNLNRMLVGWLLQNPIGELFPETLFQLDDHNSFMPDLGVVFFGRTAPGVEEWWQGAPEIAIEIVSSETASRLEQKIDRYLASGGKSVWVAFPEHRIVRIYSASGSSRKFSHDQTLEDPTVLPGFSAPLSAIFEGV